MLRQAAPQLIADVHYKFGYTRIMENQFYKIIKIVFVISFFIITVPGSSHGDSNSLITEISFKEILETNWEKPLDKIKQIYPGGEYSTVDEKRSSVYSIQRKITEFGLTSKICFKQSAGFNFEQRDDGLNVRSIVFDETNQKQRDDIQQKVKDFLQRHYSGKFSLMFRMVSKQGYKISQEANNSKILVIIRHDKDSVEIFLSYKLI